MDLDNVGPIDTTNLRTRLTGWRSPGVKREVHPGLGKNREKRVRSGVVYTQPKISPSFQPSSTGLQINCLWELVYQSVPVYRTPLHYPRRDSVTPLSRRNLRTQ